jgi:hypothetical protein
VPVPQSEEESRANKLDNMGILFCDASDGEDYVLLP